MGSGGNRINWPAASMKQNHLAGGRKRKEKKERKEKENEGYPESTEINGNLTRTWQKRKKKVHLAHLLQKGNSSF